MSHSDHAGFHRVEQERLDVRALVVLTLIAAAAGAVTGFVGGGFRWLLEHIDIWRTGTVLGWTSSHGPWGWLVPVAVSAAHSTLRPETCATTSRDRASPKLGDLFHQKRRRGSVIGVLSGVGVGGRRVPFDERKQRLAPLLVKRA